MNIAQHTKRIHPLVAVAATAVTLFSLLGIAAITGLLPNSHGTASDSGRDNVQANALTAPSQGVNEEWVTGRPTSKSPLSKSTAQGKPGAGQAGGDESAQRSPAPVAPVAHKQAQNSPVGIGVGAVIGGVLGNQVGSGDGKTLATILGAVGGGYLGNEVAKKNQ